MEGADGGLFGERVCQRLSCGQEGSEVDISSSLSTMHAGLNILLFRTFSTLVFIKMGTMVS